jgi:hypothetical protein
MKKTILLILFIFLSVRPAFSQIEDRLAQLGEDNVSDYIRPFVTSLGTAMNSNGYYTADISSMLSLSLSFRGMYILIPSDQKNFTPKLNEAGYDATKQTATVYGDKGAAYAGPLGYIVMPPGINRSFVPVAYPQVSASILGTQVILRYLPPTQIADNNDLSIFGFGIAHSISQYIPLFPIDLAVQFLYNKVEVSDIMKLNNVAFNVHASKTLGPLTPYVGIQYEKSTLDLNYTIKGESPGLATNQTISASVEGDNNFRATVGAALELAVIILNADFSISAQPVVSGGITLAF